MQKKRFQQFDLISVLYLYGGTLILALRLLATEWTEDLDLFVYLSFFAFICGVLLGASLFPGWIAALMATFYGAFTIPWLYGLTLNRDISWYDRIFNIMGLRLKVAISQYSTNIMVSDPILFLAILAVLFWVIIVVAGFVLTRKSRALVAVLLPGLALMIMSHYDQGNPSTPSYIFFFVLFALLLIGRSEYTRSLKDWAKQRISLTPKAQTDLRRGVILFIVIVLLLSWSIPLTSSQTQRYSKVWTNLTQPWETLKLKISNALQPLRNATIGKEGSFDASLGLGNSSTLGTALLFTVTPDAPPPIGINFYWKVRSYNLYMNDMWLTSNDYNYVNFFPQRFTLNTPDWIISEPYSFSFFMNTNQAGNFYFVNTPTWVSRQVEFMLQSLPDDQQDVVAGFADPLLSSGETYEVQAQLPNPTVAHLRTVEQVYPEWLERYTQLPPNFPERIHELAEGLTQSLDNPYDKAQAITRYLRNTITYSTEMGVIPERADPIEWFLFDKQSGYCNYYATAEVLMLRSIGIPARLAVGYAQGLFNDEKGSYQVRQKDKHAWPEVYFNEYGWIEFEPTSAIGLISRPLGAPVEITPQEPLITPQIEPDEPEQPDVTLPTLAPEETLFVPVPVLEKGWVLWIIGLVILTIILGLTWITWRFATPQADNIRVPALLMKIFGKFHWKSPAWLEKAGASKKFEKKAYQQLERSARLLGKPVEESLTPMERGTHLTEMLPEMDKEISMVVSEYEKEAFSPHSADLPAASEAGLKIIKTAQFQRLARIFKKKKY